VATSTTSQRAAAARRARASATPLVWARDPCPLCCSDLGGLRGVSRRRPVLTAARGTVRWHCPDCTGEWESVAGAPA
jgi:hypothetical protein